MTPRSPGLSQSAISRRRAERLERVGAELERQYTLLRQPFIRESIPTREVLSIIRQLLELAGEFRRPARAGGGKEEG